MTNGVGSDRSSFDSGGTADRSAVIDDNPVTATGSGIETPVTSDEQGDATLKPGGTSSTTEATDATAVVMDQISDAIVISSPEQRILALNPAAEQQYGLTASEAVGRRFPDVIESLNLDGSPFSVDVIRELKATGGWQGRLIHRPKRGRWAGQPMVVHVTLTARRDESGGFAGIIGMVRDVSVAANLEADLVTLNSLALATGRARTRHEVAETGLHRIVAVTEASAAYLAVFDAGRHVLLAHIGLTDDFVRRIEGSDLTSLPPLDPLAAFGNVITLTNEPPLAELIALAVEDAGIQIAKVVGLVIHGKLEGYIALGWRDASKVYSGDALLVQAAGTIAGALENARLVGRLEAGLDKERMLAARVEALMGLTQIPSSGLPRGDQQQMLLEQVVHALGGAGGFVGAARNGQFRIEAAVGLEVPLLTALLRTPPEATRMWRHLAEGGRVFAGELGTATDDPLASALFEGGAAALVAFAAQHDGEVSQAVAVWFDSKLEEQVIDERTLEAVGRIVSIAYANVRLQHEMVQRAGVQRALAQRLDALDELTRIGDEAETLDDLIASTTRLVREALGASTAAYTHITPDDRIEILAEAGNGAAFRQLLPKVEIDRLPGFSQVRRGGGSVMALFVPGMASPEGIAMAREAGFTAYAIIPIRTGDELTGMIVVHFDQPLENLGVDDAALDSVARVTTIAQGNLRLRERLAKSEERYRTLFAESPEAFRVETPDGQILDLNGAAARLYRTSRESLIGRNSAELIGIEPGELGRRRADLHQEGRGTFRGIGVRADGTRFPEEVEARMVDIDGQPRSLILVRDLSGEERLQQELLQAQKMEALGQLVSGVAHELNNPLTAIVVFSQLWRTDPRLPDDMRHDASLLQQEAERTRRIVTNLLDFARQRPPERQPTSVAALVQSVLDLQSYALIANMIDVNVDVAPDLPAIDIDRAQLQQVLLNLILNAIQAIHGDGSIDRRGRIDVQAELVPGTDPQEVRISVTDDGPGVPPEFRARLFDPFFTTKEPGKGTGLGLSVSFGIMSAHGGHLWYEPAPTGSGSKFLLQMPVTADGSGLSEGERRFLAGAGAGRGAPALDVEAEPVSGEREAGAESPGPEGRSPRKAPGRSSAGTARSDSSASLGTEGRVSDTAARGPDSDGTAAEERGPARRPLVLILDDEASIRTFLAKALGLAKMDTLEAAAGAEALEALRAGSFDVLLVDHRMAGMSGIEFHERALQLCPEVRGRVVFMSGDVLNPELRSFADTHGVRLLAKPFDIDAVRRVVLEVLDVEGLVSG